MSDNEGEYDAQGGKGNCRDLCQKALVIDTYGRPFLFMLPNHQQRYKSIVGSICTVFILSVVFIYAVYKFQLLIDKDESRIQKVLIENFFDETKYLSQSEGFNLAYGIASYKEP